MSRSGGDHLSFDVDCPTPLRDLPGCRYGDGPPPADDATETTFRSDRGLHPVRSSFGWGLPGRPSHPGRRCALTAPFHPYHARQPSELGWRRSAVFSLLHLPWSRDRSALPTIPSFEARTFLPPIHTLVSRRAIASPSGNGPPTTYPRRSNMSSAIDDVADGDAGSPRRVNAHDGPALSADIHWHNDCFACDRLHHADGIADTVHPKMGRIVGDLFD